MPKLQLIVVAGPTASGKSDCATRLCRLIGGEVISADSMQVYRGMDVGTAKPTAEEMGGVPHHMIDVADPAGHYSAGAYRDAANRAIREIADRGNRPVLCGGTGLYIDAVTRPMRLAVPGDEAVRRELQAIADGPNGRESLHAMLADIDPPSAARLHINDVRRVVRALEIHRLTGQTATELAKLDAAREGDYDVVMFALDWPREALYRRIDARVDQMIAQGLVDEVRRLLCDVGDGAATAMQALGYKEVAAALRGKISMDQAVAAIKQGTRNYAKRQLTWFKRDGRVRWIPAQGRDPSDIAREMMEALDR
ncbi:MAG: tRNA (adenosine(37)-N6)-dimethylallyltransferase MiaA [Clostridiales bacterium]|nr:tRNA (adenosine(37)-N6)-dimethylallyltransferase MiaA [Clostridiales bacterium]